MIRWSLLGLLLCSGCGRLEFDRSAGDLGPRISYPPNVHAVLDQTQLAIVPVSNGGTFHFSVQPELPVGLLLNGTTGELSGIPSQVTDRKTYVITAESRAGRATARVRLTVLPGSVVTSTMDTADDDGGVDPVCRATTAGGCTLRAAVQTANHHSGLQLVLLSAATYALRTSLDPITGNLVIAGQDADVTTVRAAAIHPGYRMATLATEHTLRLEDATFQDFGPADGGVLLVTDGVLEAYAAIFANNEAASSGGVLDIGEARAVFEHTAFVGNHAQAGNGWGGVINGSSPGTSIVVKQSTATQNVAVWGSFSHITTGTQLLLENSTLYGNTTTRAGTLASPGGTYTLVNDTIVYNSNTFEDSAALYSFAVPASYSVTNTIIAFNTDASGKQNNCNRNDLGTELKSGGGNLFSDKAGNCGSYFTGARDLLGVDPHLDPAGPADNGGLTRTISLSPGSMAIDHGQSIGCPVEDQRGMPRPAGGQCDIGALEMQ